MDMDMKSFTNLSWNELADRLDRLQHAQAPNSDLDRLIHELHVHQIELEMQNRELRESQARLEASRARYEELYDQAPVGYVTLDITGVITEANITAAAMLGHPRALLVGTPFTSAADLRDVTAFHAHLRACLKSRGKTTVEIENTTASGTLRVLQLTTVSVVSGNGNVLSYRMTIADLTEQHHAEHERAQLERERRARVEADEANRMKDQFLGIVSHELRSPLNVILTWSQMLNTRPNDREVVARGLQVMHRNGRLLARIVDDILDVSRIVSGKLYVTMAKLDFGDVVRAALEGVRADARTRGVEIHETIGPDCATRGDAVRLEQVVANVLTNAIKFGKAGGHVWVTLARGQHAVRLTVRDDGCGIDRADLPHIFESFRQADSSTTRFHTGLGLGLAIAKHIVEAHGGTIEATSDGRDRGVTMTIEVPPGVFSTPPPPRPASHPQVADASLKGVRVLFVDDEAEACELASLTFEDHEADVRTAQAVDEALVLLQSFQPDVIVSDISMPGRDGHDLIRQVRRMAGPIAATPAIALTAYARAEDAERAIRAGFTRHLAKPIGADAIVALVVETIRRRGDR